MLAAALAAATAAVAGDESARSKTPPGGHRPRRRELHLRRPTIGSRFANLFLRGKSLRRLITHLCNACPGQVQDPITHVVCIMMTSPVSISISEAGVCPFQDHPLLLYPFHVMTLKQRRFLRDLVVYFRDNYHRLQPPCRFGGTPGRRAACHGGRGAPRVAEVSSSKGSQARDKPACSQQGGGAAGALDSEEEQGSTLRLQGGCLVETLDQQKPSGPAGQWAGSFLDAGVINQHRDLGDSPAGGSCTSQGSFSSMRGRGVSGRAPGGPARTHAGSPAGQKASPVYLKAENILESVCKSVFSSSVHRDTYRRLAICNIFLQRISAALHLSRDSMDKVGEILERLHLEAVEGTQGVAEGGSN